MKNHGIYLFPLRVRDQRGFVLPFILFIIQIIILFTSAAFLITQMNMRQASTALISMSELNDEKTIITELVAKNDFSTLPCIIPMTAWKIVRLQSHVWWLSNGCQATRHGINFYYVVEHLGDDDCGLMSEIENEHADIASYYRVSLKDANAVVGHPSLMLQATIALPNRRLYECNQHPHRVKAGRQMWRQL